MQLYVDGELLPGEAAKIPTFDQRDRLSLTSGSRHSPWSYRPPLDAPKRPALGAATRGP
jgi:hypothetical protein